MERKEIKRSERDLKGKRALVTGGTRGIGRAVAEKMIRLGAHVIVTGTSIDSLPPEGAARLVVDFRKEACVMEFARNIEREQIDILVNNAGINRVAPIGDMAPTDFTDVYKVNVVAPFFICRSVIPHMKSGRWGRIVNVSSIWGKISRSGRAAYSSSKFALDGLTTSIAAEVAEWNILANCVAPGFINTELTRSVLGEVGMKEVARQVPIRRLGEPEEIADFIVWLAGPENTYISGQNLAIDGGFTRV